MRFILAAVAALQVAACASDREITEAGRAALPMLDASAVLPVALIGPGDLLKLTVFQVPDLSLNEVRVDASGAIQVPLLGAMSVAGRAPQDVAADIENRLGQRYLRHPQVTLAIVEAADQKITVDGAVTKPGVYKMQGPTTLLQAIAMAEGPTRVADLERVAVFRRSGGRRMVAQFDVRQIRAGLMEDPLLSGSDTVIVDTSRSSALMREVLSALPGLAVFSYF